MATLAGRRQGDTGWWSSRLGRPLTTAVWLAAAGVVVGLGLIICVVSWSSHILDDERQTSVSDAAPPSTASTARRRRLKNSLRPREYRHNTDHDQYRLHRDQNTDNFQLVTFWSTAKWPLFS